MRSRSDCLLACLAVYCALARHGWRHKDGDVHQAGRLQRTWLFPPWLRRGEARLCPGQQWHGETICLYEAQHEYVCCSVLGLKQTSLMGSTDEFKSCDDDNEVGCIVVKIREIQCTGERPANWGLIPPQAKHGTLSIGDTRIECVRFIRRERNTKVTCCE